MSANTAGGGRHRPPVDRLGQLSTLALGAAGGLAINTASPDVGYRGAAGALLAGMVISTIRWFRRLPGGAPLVRYSPVVLLGLAMCCAVLTLVRPGSWATTSVMLGVGLATVGVLLPTDRELTWRLLRGVAFAGVGVAFAGAGIATLHGRETVIGTALLGVGVAFAGAGIATLHGDDVVLGIADIGVGVVFIGFGIAGLAVGHTLVAMAGTLFGLGCVGVGIAALRRGGTFWTTGSRGGGDILLGPACTLQGVAFIGMGLATMLGDDTLLAVAGVGGGTPLEIALIGVGVALVGGGIATLHGRRTLLGLATIVFGAVAFAAFGIPALRGGGTLPGAAGIALGVAALGVGVTTLGRAGVWVRLGRRAGALTRDPATLNPAPGAEELIAASPGAADRASPDERD